MMIIIVMKANAENAYQVHHIMVLSRKISVRANIIKDTKWTIRSNGIMIKYLYRYDCWKE